METLGNRTLRCLTTVEIAENCQAAIAKPDANNAKRLKRIQFNPFYGLSLFVMKQYGRKNEINDGERTVAIQGW